MTTKKEERPRDPLPVDILEEETVFAGKWLVTKRLQISKTVGDVEKREMWEIVSRNKFSKSEAHGVYVVPIIEVDGKPKDVVVVKQFRLPLRQYVLEFPGGFIKEGQSVEDTALRELWEETGYTGKIIKERLRNHP